MFNRSVFLNISLMISVIGAVKALEPRRLSALIAEVISEALSVLVPLVAAFLGAGVPPGVREGVVHLDDLDLLTGMHPSHVDFDIRGVVRLVLAVIALVPRRLTTYVLYVTR